MPAGPSYEYAEESSPTALVRDNMASYGAAARDAGRGAGDDVYRRGSASSLVYVIGILDRGFDHTDCSVRFLKQVPALAITLTHPASERWGSTNFAREVFSKIH
jgi:hypothetical protein